MAASSPAEQSRAARQGWAGRGPGVRSAARLCKGRFPWAQPHPPFLLHGLRRRLLSSRRQRAEADAAWPTGLQCWLSSLTQQLASPSPGETKSPAPSGPRGAMPRPTMTPDHRNPPVFSPPGYRGNRTARSDGPRLSS